MISFKGFLFEQFKRGKGIQHLIGMKPLDFLQLLQKIEKELPNVKVKITEKVDGAALTIGLDNEGKFFIQTARSDRIYHGSEFVKFAKERNKPLDIAKAYENLFNFLKNYQPLQKVLRKYFNGKGYGIRGEVLWIELAQEIKEKGIRFVAIEYDKNKIGQKLTFVPFKVLYLDGTEFEKEKELIEDLKKISNREVKIETPDLEVGDLNFEIVLRDYRELLKKYKDIEKILKSRKKKDKEVKEVLKKLIQELQRKLANEIMQKVKHGKFGDEIEGLVIDFCGVQCKIQSETFKKKKFGEGKE